MAGDSAQGGYWGSRLRTSRAVPPRDQLIACNADGTGGVAATRPPLLTHSRLPSRGSEPFLRHCPLCFEATSDGRRRRRGIASRRLLQNTQSSSLGSETGRVRSTSPTLSQTRPLLFGVGSRTASTNPYLPWHGLSPLAHAVLHIGADQQRYDWLHPRASRVRCASLGAEVAEPP